MKKTKILYDLSLAHKNHGLSGIPQETRFLFALLSSDKNFEVHGLIPNQTPSLKTRDLTNLLEQSKFLFSLNKPETILPKQIWKQIIYKIENKIKKLKYLSSIFKINFKVFDLNPSIDMHVIWRIFFDGMIDPAISTQVSNWKFVISELNKIRRRIGIKPARLKTDDYKIAFFQDLNFVKCSKNTRMIIRYHDGIPVLSPDLVSGTRHIENHYQKIKEIENKAIFVCNSKPSLEHLKTISPIAAEKSLVIPCAVDELKRSYPSTGQIFEYIKIYASKFSRSLSPDLISIWKEALASPKLSIRYILTISSLEPKKNHIKLVSSWLKARNDLQQDIKLIIVGSLGWNYEEITECLIPHIKDGNILHLEKIPQNVKQDLLSFVDCFIFPSIMEGFGIPPIEAQMCKCPVAVSAIDSLKYSCGEGALYFNPYDVNNISDSIKKLLNLTENERDKIILKGSENSQRYNKETIAAQWQQLFLQLI